MKFLRKLNKGLVLTTIVLVILVGYIINTEIQRNNQKDEIKEVCEKYLEFESEYSLLPEEYRKINSKITQEELNNYYEEMEEELKKLSIEDEKILNSQRNAIKENIQMQLDSNNITISKTNKLLKISKYQFDGNQVNVSLENLLEWETIYLENSTYNNETKEYEGEERTTSDSMRIQDTITLKKEDGNWKVIYANVGMAMITSSEY